jgi:sporulation protein YlmC with PRC-barrel domain
MRISYAEGLSGRAVVDATGRVIGELSELIIDTDTWKADAILVRLRRGVAGEIGVQRGPFRAAVLEVPIEAIQSVADAVVLRRDVASLRSSERGGPPPDEHRPAP